VEIALSLVVLAAAVIAVTGLARLFDLSAPLVLIAVGIIASFLPFVPEVRLTSEIVLVGLLPPLLYSAALQSSLVDFNANRRPILLLSIGLVVFTAAGVAVVVHLIIPDLTWPAAFAIGAVVAPPDAVAATAIAKRIGMPRRIVTILEGESLLNDATALVALRTAILAAASLAAVSVVRVTWEFVVAAGGGVLVGLLTFVVVGWLRRRFTDPVFDTSVSFVTPFAAYVLAEEIHGSGVLAVVVAGLLLGHKAPVLQTASSRIAERLNWRTVSFLLENAVFLLIGLQARGIVQGVAGSKLPPAVIIWSCVAALLAVMVLRFVWVFPSRLLLKAHRVEGRRPERAPWTYLAVLGWAGMRGVVTLAAAFAIPASFPHRDVLILIALTVTAGTLLIQGTSLPWLVRRLKVPAPDPRDDSLARAVLFQKATFAGLERLAAHEGEDDPHHTVDALRRRVEQRDFAAWERLGGEDPDSETPSETYTRLRLEMLQAERGRVLEARTGGHLPHDVVEDVLGALDVEESMLDVRSRRDGRFRERLTAPGGITKAIRVCEHLRDAPTDTTPNVDGACEDCLKEGTTWVHLRLCMSCGHVGCCDSSLRRHATAHYHGSGHPVMRSAEPGEEWRWCFVDNRLG
jgi:CPA1 family monovalent cation:H+ antiporter